MRSIFIGFFFYYMIDYYKKDEIGIIEFSDSDSKVNLLSNANLDALKGIIDYIAEKDSYIKALFFISTKEGIFIAGADIKELAVIRTREEAMRLCRKGQTLFNKIEDLAVPTFAVVDGACVGGGFELALSCRFILATRNKKTKFGLPEIRLGITPGFGGRHRLAKRIGRKRADLFINTGCLVNSKEARRLKIVDRLISGSEKFCYQKLIKIYRRHRCVAARDVMTNNKERVERDRLEREILAEKILQAPARNSLSSYLLVSKYRNYSWLEDISKKTRSIKRCAVIGAGTMGRSITYLISSEADLPVSLREVDKSILKKAKWHIKDVYKDAIRRGILCNDEARTKFRNISFGNHQIMDADIVIESVTEDISIKKRVFTELEQGMQRDSILATNTSCLTVEELAKPIKNIERFIGIHFFNPAYKMKLVEVVPTGFTSRAILETVIGFLRRLGRIPIIVKDSPGFLVNRILLPYLNEAVFMVEEGFSVQDIDSTILDFGMPMGPLQVLKEIGLDVAYKASKILEDRFGSRMKVPDTLKPGAKKIIQSQGKRSSHRASQDIVERLLIPMRREAGLCLEEGVVVSREIIDLALFLGIGFPASKRL